MPNMAESGGEVPIQLASTTPALPINAISAQTGMIISNIQDDIKNIKTDLREIRSEISTVKTELHNNFVRILTIYGAGFLIIMGSFVYAYNRIDDKISRDMESVRDSISKLDDNFRKNEILSTKMDTKLEGLLQRATPSQSAIAPGMPK